MAEKISVITISYNSIKTIEKTFMSVLAQSYRPLEYVLVDGGSTDGTIEYIKKCIPKFLNAGIEVNFKSEKDNGISDAFNKGICRATGEIIGIINSDDQLANKALEKVAEHIGNADVICGDCVWVDDEHGLRYVRKSKMKLGKLKYEMVLMHPTCFVRITAYMKYGGFDTNFKYAMDKELMARFYREGATFTYIHDVLSIMRAGGASDANEKKVIDEGIRIAVENGEPRLWAILRSKIKTFERKAIRVIKNYPDLWQVFRGNKE